MIAQDNDNDLDPAVPSSSLSRSSSSSSTSSRLNAGAPEFVPRSSSPSTTPRLVVVMPQSHNPNPNPNPSPSPSPTSPHLFHQHHLHHHHHHVANHSHSFAFPKQPQQEPPKLQAVDPDHVQAPPTRNNNNNNNGVSLSDDSRHKILNQVEYYFSDINLATTDHLMKFISKDPEGYVPISVVSSFKKIKFLASSLPQLASVLRKSSKLVVSDDGKKVRRQHPLTESDMEDLQSRIVLAENLPEDHTYQNLMKVFSSVGSVKTIRTCQPQNSNGGASGTSRSKFENSLSINKLHAFVEYETVEIAEKAVSDLNDERNWRSGLKVRLMPKRMSKPLQARGRKFGTEEGNAEEDDLSTSEQLNDKQSEDHSQSTDSTFHEQNVEDNIHDKEGGARRGRGRGRGKGRGRGQHHNNSRGGHHIGTPPSGNFIHSEQSTVTKHPPGPRMPDGTRGFTMGRGKLLVADSA